MSPEATPALEPGQIPLEAAATFTGVSTRTLRRWADLGWGPARKVSRRLLFSVADLRKWIADGSQPPPLPKPGKRG
jgi:hypothetical protein